MFRLGYRFAMIKKVTSLLKKTYVIPWYIVAIQLIAFVAIYFFLIKEQFFLTDEQAIWVFLSILILSSIPMTLSVCGELADLHKRVEKLEKERNQSTGS